MSYGTLISTVTVGASPVASINFASIPATYTDLKLVLSLRNDAAQIAFDSYIQFNGDTAANYSMRWLLGDGSSGASSFALTMQATGGRVGASVGASATANTFSSADVYIANYTSSTAKKFSSDGVTEYVGSNSRLLLEADSWAGTAPITSISIFCQASANFVQYSSASLYGILKGSGGASVA